jgi:hypothetical protein
VARDHHAREQVQAPARRLGVGTHIAHTDGGAAAGQAGTIAGPLRAAGWYNGVR